MDERDLLSASIRSGANFNECRQFSRIEDCVALLKDFCTASTKRLLTLHKYKSKVQEGSHKIYTEKLTTTQLICNYTVKLNY